MFRKVFHINAAEGAQPTAGSALQINAFDLQALEQLPAEVQSGGRRGYFAGFFCIYRLVPFAVRALQPLRRCTSAGRVARIVELLLEFFVRAIVQEADRSPARGRIVYRFSHEHLVIVVVTKYNLLPTRILRAGPQDIPQTGFVVEFPRSKKLRSWRRFFFLAVRRAGKTLVLLKIIHRLRRSSSISLKMRCSILPLSRWTTISRDSCRFLRVLGD